MKLPLFGRLVLVGIVVSLLGITAAAKAAVVFNSLLISYSDIYSSSVDFSFSSDIYGDGAHTLSSPSPSIYVANFGGRIASLSSWEATINVSGNSATLNSFTWNGLDSSVSSVHGNLQSIFDYHGWNVGSGNYQFNFTAVSSPVPIPTTAWLFGSALSGLLAVKSKQ